MNKNAIRMVIVIGVVAVLTLVAIPLASYEESSGETIDRTPTTSTWDGWTKLASDTLTLVDGSKYYLDGDLTLTGTITVPVGVKAYLDLIGKQLVAKENTRMFTVQGTLIVQDYAYFKKTDNVCGSLVGNGTLSGNGGCIYISAGQVQLFDVVIKGFKAVNGAAIYSAASTTLHMTDVFVGDVDATTSVTLLSPVERQNLNTSVGLNNRPYATASLSNAEDGNVATTNGGAIYLLGNLTVTNSIFRGNSAYSTSGNNSGGGAIYVGEGATATIVSGEFQYNMAPNGGAINALGSLNLGTGGDVRFTGNVANYFCNIPGNGLGGAILIKGSIQTMKNLAFEYNIAGRYGGAMEIMNASVSSFTDCSFIGNQTVVDDAGALVINVGSESTKTLTFSNCKFTDNTAGSWVFTHGIDVLVPNGGALSLYGGNIILDLGTTVFSGNKALNGGAICCGGSGYTSIMTIKGGSMSGNSALVNGGGVYVDGSLTMESGIIQDCSSVYGGGVYVKNNFTMTGGKIIHNSASTAGGDVYVDPENVQTVSISGGQISSVDSIAQYIQGAIAKIYDHGKLTDVIIPNSAGAYAVIRASNGTYSAYYDMDSAFKKAVSGSTIVMLGVPDDTANYTLKAGIVLDLNGKSVGFSVTEEGTIMDSSFVGLGSVKVTAANTSAHDGADAPYPSTTDGKTSYYARVSATIKLYGNGGANGGSETVDQPVSWVTSSNPNSITTIAYLSTDGWVNGTKKISLWNTKADGSGSSYLSSITVGVNDSIDLYAIWADTAPTYLSISFSSSGGKVYVDGVATDSILHDVSQTESKTYRVTLTPLAGYKGPVGDRVWTQSSIGVESVTDSGITVDQSDGVLTITIKGSYTLPTAYGFKGYLFSSSLEKIVYHTVTYVVDSSTKNESPSAGPYRLMCIDDFIGAIPEGKVFVGWQVVGGAVVYTDCSEITVTDSDILLKAMLMDRGCTATWVPSSVPEVS